MMNRPTDHLERYLALWHQGDDARRAAEVQALWVPDGTHYSASAVAHGYDELAARVLRSYKRWVVDEGCIFRLAGPVVEHNGALTFGWEMIPRNGGDVISAAHEFHLFAADGRLQTAYQFITA
jgi:hypothetical protein